MCQYRERWRFIEEVVPDEGDHSEAMRSTDADLADLAPSFEAWATRHAPAPSAPPSRQRWKASRLPRGKRFRLATELVPPVPGSILEGSRWRRVLAGAWRHSDAIHNKECRASILGLRRASEQRSSWGRVVLALARRQHLRDSVDRERTSVQPCA